MFQTVRRRWLPSKINAGIEAHCECETEKWMKEKKKNISTTLSSHDFKFNERAVQLSAHEDERIQFETMMEKTPLEIKWKRVGTLISATTPMMLLVVRRTDIGTAGVQLSKCSDNTSLSFWSQSLNYSNWKSEVLCSCLGLSVCVCDMLRYPSALCGFDRMRVPLKISFHEVGIKH